MQYKKTQVRVVSSEKLTVCKTIYLLQIGLYMRHFCTPNIGLIFENKQLSKQFSLYAKRTTQSLDQNHLSHTHKEQYLQKTGGYCVVQYTHLVYAHINHICA